MEQGIEFMKNVLSQQISKGIYLLTHPTRADVPKGAGALWVKEEDGEAYFVLADHKGRKWKIKLEALED